LSGSFKPDAEQAMNPRDRSGEASGHKPLITFPSGSLLARFCRREKRFRVEVETEDGRWWVHTNNSGSMVGLLRPGAPVLVSPAANPGRRLPYTLELIQLDGIWVGVNTLTPNRMLARVWREGLLPELAPYDHYRSEAKIGKSRLDASLSGSKGRLWVEAKNVTLVEEDVAYFPDAVTDRGQKHLEELIRLAGEGQKVACFYLIQRSDARCFAPADFIDPAFTKLFWQALDAGVEAWPYRAAVSPEGIGLGRRLAVNGASSIPS
jgi:sugar fermentation stimulation protein A